MAFMINDVSYDESSLKLLNSISRTEYKEFLFFTETLYKADDDVYILDTHYQKNPIFWEIEEYPGDFDQQHEYRIISNQEAEQWLDDSVWYV
ncbi:MAG: hypothetical protein IJO52_04300 [Clostridia bacterium]|nr:hypothetical protein [Clostridia bacterium]